MLKTTPEAFYRVSIYALSKIQEIYDGPMIASTFMWMILRFKHTSKFSIPSTVREAEIHPRTSTPGIPVPAALSEIHGRLRGRCFTVVVLSAREQRKALCILDRYEYQHEEEAGLVHV